MKRFVGFVSVVVIIGLASWTGLSYYAGGRAEQDIRRLMAQPAEKTPIRLTDLTHHRGLFDSRGELVLHYPDPAATVQPRPDLFRMKITYSIDHFALPKSVFRFGWTAQPIDEAAQRLKAVFGQNPMLMGAGQLTWQGEASSSYQIPTLKATEGADFVRMAAVAGNLRVLGRVLDFELTMPYLETRVDGELFRLENIQLGLALEDRLAGVGESSFAIDKLFFNAGTAAGLQILGRNRLANERLSIRSDWRLASLTVTDHTINDIELQVALDDLDHRSLHSLSAVMNVAGNLDNLNPAQRLTVQQAIREIVLKGFSLGVPRVAARMGQGEMVGELALTLKPAAAASSLESFDATKQFVSAGKLLLRGEGLPMALVGAGTFLGILVQTPDGYAAGYHFRDGALVFNGQQIDATDSIALINEVMGQLLNLPTP